MSCCCKGVKGYWNTVPRLTPSGVCDDAVFPVRLYFPDGSNNGKGKLIVYLKRSDFTSLPSKWFSATANEALVRALAYGSAGLVVVDNKAEWEFTTDYVKLVADIELKGERTDYRRIYEVVGYMWNNYQYWGSYSDNSSDGNAELVKFLTAYRKNKINSHIELEDGTVHPCMVSFSLDFQYMTPNTSTNVVGGSGGSGNGIDDGSGGGGGGGGGSNPCLTVLLHTWMRGLDSELNPKYTPITISESFSGWRDFERHKFIPPEAMGYVDKVELTDNEKINNTHKEVPIRISANFALVGGSVRGGFSVNEDEYAPESHIEIKVNQSCIRSMLDYGGLGGGTIYRYFNSVSDALQFAKDKKLGMANRDKAWSSIDGQYVEISDSPNYYIWMLAYSANDASHGSSLWGGLTGFKYDFEYDIRYKGAWRNYEINDV